jgi:hypothetical protein
MLGGPLSAADLSSKLVQKRPGQTEGAPLVLLHEKFRAANGVLFNCLSQLVHPENAIRNISLLEIVIPVLRPHRVTLANDLEIVVCKDERIDILGLGIVADPADNFHIATMNAAYIPDPAIRKDDQVGSG